MELPERKLNCFQEYDYSQNGAYFVTICTQDRHKILSSIVGDGFSVPKPCGIIAEEIIAQIPVKHPSVAVDKYVIMPDHNSFATLFYMKLSQNFYYDGEKYDFWEMVCTTDKNRL